MSEHNAILRLLVYADDAQVYVEALKRALGERLSIQSTADRDEAIRMLPSQDAIAAFGTRLDDGILAAGVRLRWVHSLTSGVEKLLASRLLRSSTIVTSSRGIHGPQMAEMSLLLMMALVRQLPRMLKNQEHAVWERWPQPLLFGKHVVIVGVGSIAVELAPRCRAFGMRVTGVSTVMREVPQFDEIRLRPDLPEVLRTADFVVLLVPFDETSKDMFDAQMLRSLPSHSILVNLSRGGVVDETALHTALSEGRLAGAGMDVFGTEPLPADSPLWKMSNVIVTPHVAGFSDIYAQQAVAPLLRNVCAMLEGRLEDLANRVR